MFLTEKTDFSSEPIYWLPGSLKVNGK